MATSKTLNRVKAIRASLPATYVFDERDETLLELAEQQARHIDALEEDVRKRGVRHDGDKLNSAIREARNGRIALARILGQVDMPEAGTTARIHARKAANGRWKAAA
jgi:hypothetical protein